MAFYEYQIVYLKILFNSIKDKIKKFINIYNGNLLVLLGLLLINIGIYLFSFKIGIILTGLFFVLIGYLINHNK